MRSNATEPLYVLSTFAGAHHIHEPLGDSQMALALVAERRKPSGECPINAAKPECHWAIGLFHLKTPADVLRDTCRRIGNRCVSGNVVSASKFCLSLFQDLNRTTCPN